MFKRLFDIAVALCCGILLIPIACTVAIAIKIESRGPVLFWSTRLGKSNDTFRMPKFRSMKLDTPAVATDQLENPTLFITKLGGFLRTTSLDEIPQLWSVLVGDMSLIGPRPALFNQAGLIKQRTRVGIHTIRPGITGWAQINGRDTLSTEKKVSLDKYYLTHQNFSLDVKILWLTIVAVAKRDSVAH